MHYCNCIIIVLHELPSPGSKRSRISNCLDDPVRSAVLTQITTFFSTIEQNSISRNISPIRFSIKMNYGQAQASSKFLLQKKKVRYVVMVWFFWEVDPMSSVASSGNVFFLFTQLTRSTYDTVFFRTAQIFFIWNIWHRWSRWAS
jgi:hypothetical protein